MSPAASRPEPAVRSLMRRAPTARHRIARADESAHREHNRGAEEARQTKLTQEYIAAIRAIFDEGGEFTVKDIATRVQHGIAQITPFIYGLVSSREIVGEMRAGHKTWYRKATPADFANKPPIKSIAVPAFDAEAFRAAVEKVLASGASYDVRELVHNLRSSWPQVGTEMVGAALLRLIEDAEVEEIKLGSTTRYRRSADAPRPRLNGLTAPFSIGDAVRYKPGTGTYGYEESLEDDGRLPAKVIGFTDTRVRIAMSLKMAGNPTTKDRAVDAESLVHA